MYKNIIFDFGGVVVDFAPKDFLMDHFMNRRAEEETYELVFGSQEWQDLDRGTITREAANKQMLEHAAEAGRIFEVQTCIDEWATMLRTKKTTVQIMRKLKAAGYRLYYLTNIPTDIMDELRQREWFSLIESDQYVVIGEILNFYESENSLTNEKLWILNLNCNNLF